MFSNIISNCSSLYFFLIDYGDYYSNPAVITIKQFHFFQKEFPIKYHFNESIKDQSFCYCNFSKIENCIVVLKDSSSNNNDIKCYNSDLINKEIIYNNLKI